MALMVLIVSLRLAGEGVAAGMDEGGSTMAFVIKSTAVAHEGSILAPTRCLSCFFAPPTR